MFRSYFFYSNASNLIYFVVYAVLSILLSNDDFGVVRTYIGWFFLYCSVAQLGLNVGIVSESRNKNIPQNLVAKILFLLFFSHLVVFVVLSNYLLNLILGLSGFLFSCFLIFSAIHQSNGDHKRLLIYQNLPKIIFYLSLLIFLFDLGFNLWAGVLLVLLLFSWVILYRRVTNTKSDIESVGFFNLLKSSLIPFVISVSTVLGQHFEFIMLKSTVSNSELIGYYAKYSYLYLVITAAFYFMQNKYVTDVATNKFSLKKLYSHTFFVSGVILLILFLLYVFLDSGYLDFLISFDNSKTVYFIIALKTFVWSTYFIGGSLIYYLGFKKLSLILGLLHLVISSILIFLDFELSIIGLAAINIMIMSFSSFCVNFVLLRGKFLDYL